MRIAILTFEGFNELDSLIALGILNRIKRPDWQVALACPTARVRSMNGVVVESQMSLDDACKADAVVVGSGVLTRDIVNDSALLEQLRLDPARQLLAAQCSGTLILAKLGLLAAVPACTDLTTKPWVEEAGVSVLNQPFFAAGNIATAGGCFASQYLAAWIISRLVGIEAARAAIHYVAPVGEKEEYVARALRNIEPYLPAAAIDIDAFKSRVRQGGATEVLERIWQPNEIVPDHSHPFSANALVVRGEMWLTIDAHTRHLVPGDTFELAQGQLHSERYGPAGAVYWVGRR